MPDPSTSAGVPAVVLRSGGFDSTDIAALEGRSGDRMAQGFPITAFVSPEADQNTA